MKEFNSLDQGFTLIEIILVIGIISILILFATANFGNQVSYAKEAHISSDIMILESIIENHIRRTGRDGLIDFNKSLDYGYMYDEASIRQVIEEEKLFDSKGLMDKKSIVTRLNQNGYIDSGNYYGLSEEYLGSIGDRSLLKGRFLVQKISIGEDEIEGNVLNYNNIRVKVIYLNKNT